MTCREFVDFLARYFGDDLSAAERLVFNEHLAECSDCVAYLRTYDQTVRLAAAAFDDSAEGVAREVPEELVQAILALRRARWD